MRLINNNVAKKTIQIELINLCLNNRESWYYDHQVFKPIVILCLETWQGGIGASMGRLIYQTWSQVVHSEPFDCFLLFFKKMLLLKHLSLTVAITAGCFALVVHYRLVLLNTTETKLLPPCTRLWVQIPACWVLWPDY